MEPITLATLTAAVTVLATECAKGFAGEAGKSLWSQVKSLLGWGQAEPPPAELADRVARQLQKDPAAAKQLVELLQQTPEAGDASTLVGHIDAEKVVVAGKIEVQGDFKM